MSSPPLIQCSNPDCLHSENLMGQTQCDRCQSPLAYRHLWAAGAGVERFPIGTQIGGRYLVTAPQVWLDTRPGLLPDVPDDLPELALPYLHLYAHRSHLPELYGFYRQDGKVIALLLDHVPLEQSGELRPAIATVWAKASPARQVYWLWQILELWLPLRQQKVASSLLVANNLRIDGWRVRLRELIADPQEMALDASAAPGLSALANLWLSWMESAHRSADPALLALCQEMQQAENSDAGVEAIATRLNQILLEQAAQLPLHLSVAGATSTGSQRAHNEDACYPDAGQAGTPHDQTLLPYCGIICDGIGGHEGGEVASHLALRSLQLQIQALLTELTEQPEVMPPALVAQQLEAVVRVVNNMIAAQNDTQGRASRQRMGTTLVMALQLPQQVNTPDGLANAHELYLTHVGDSRAYWITPRSCHRLTVDDDVAVREVRLGRSLHWEALRRADASALTQALGTRDAEGLQVTVQRFIVEENGLLLLCSDGLSDNDLVERSWEEVCSPLFKGQRSLDATLKAWLERANQENGHDNISVVLMHYQVSHKTPQLFAPEFAPKPISSLESEWSETSKALLDETDEAAPEPVVVGKKPGRSPSFGVFTLGLVTLMFLVGAVGMVLWRQTDPAGFQRTLERVQETINPPTQP